MTGRGLSAGHRSPPGRERGRRGAVYTLPVLTPRQEQVLRKVILTYQQTAQPVGSKALAQDEDLGVRASTIRNDLAQLEEHGLLAHPHTSAGRIPTDAGYRYFVDRLLPEPVRDERVELGLVRVQIDEAMRVATETPER